MAKRKTPKSAVPTVEAITPEVTPLPVAEVAANPLQVEPAIVEASLDAPEAAVLAIETIEHVDALLVGEAPVIGELSVGPDESATLAPVVQAEAPAIVANEPRRNHFFLRAASIALAVAFGAAVGSLAPVALERMTSSASADIAPNDPTAALTASIEKLTAEFATLKAEGAEADRSVDGRLTALTERFDADAKQQGELVARVAEIANALAARPTTAAAVSDEITGSVEPPKPAIADGWTLWRVHNGRALVEGHGRLYDIVPGADLPGLGPVQRIHRSEGRWVVVTQNGIIVPRRG